jgi:CBS domain-containing protein
MELLRSCEHLRREHRLIGDVVAALGALSERGQSGASNVAALPIAGAIDFFAWFVAGCHDAKEDRALFPALVAAGVEDGGLMARLRAQHQEGERLLGVLRSLTRRHRAEGEAWQLLGTYLDLVRGHITSEDDALFPLAEGVLSPEDDATLERAFRHIEDAALGSGGNEVLVSLASAVVHVSTVLAAEPPGIRPPVLARDIMRPKPSTVAPGDSLARAAELMTSLGIRELPVVEDRSLVGILTRTDLEPYRGHFEWTAVRTAMTRSPVAVAPETPAAAVVRLLLSRGFNAVPVVEGGELVGVISRADALRALTAA